MLNFIPGSGIVLSIMSGLFKPLLTTRVIDDSPRVIPIYTDESGLECGITARGETLPVMRVKDPHVLSLNGATVPPGTDAGTLDRIRREIALHAEPLVGEPHSQNGNGRHPPPRRKTHQVPVHIHD